jgi:hypothetical protein
MSDPLWTTADLAAHLRLAKSTVADYVTKQPHKLPPRVEGLSPRWVPAVVHAWCAAQSRATPKGGRPRKVG